MHRFSYVPALPKSAPDLSWPKGADAHTHAIALLDRVFGRTGHAPSTVYIVENYLREFFLKEQQ